MEWLYAIIGGLLAGIIAKALVKGDEPGGFIITALIGIIGGIIGKIVLGFLNLPNAGNPVLNLVVAVIGAVILLLIYHAVRGTRTTTTL